VVDCQNGTPFFAPLFAGRRLPVVQVVHHVHQDQFATRFSPAMASVGRFLEGPVSRRVYARHTLTAVSASTRQELRSRLKIRTPIFVVPNGTTTSARGGRLRSAEPTLVIVNRLVPHKRIDLLLNQLGTVIREIPQLRVHVVGDGPELLRLQRQAVVLGLAETVRFHGYQPDHVRDALLSQAWLTASVSAAEGWGCSVIEAAAFGVPCLGLWVPGIRDSVVPGQTGWLVEPDGDIAAALVDALRHLSDEGHAARIAEQCRQWAACFNWDRSAELLAGVVRHEISAQQRRRERGGAHRRVARSDIATVVSFRSNTSHGRPADIRSTDQVTHTEGSTSLLLIGCDEVGAQTVVHRLGVRNAHVRLAARHDLLAGPAAPSTPAAVSQHGARSR
jgi:glycosyltransferase involved in cell wall biosynthesis